MIIGRIAHAITRQDWSTLLIELFVLVLGIFIGLQVDDWNSARIDRQDEREFLLRLQADLDQADTITSRIRDRLIARRDATKSASEVLFRQVPRNTLEDIECTSIATSSLFNSIAPLLPAYAELVGTGRLDIIQDPELLRALIGLEQSRVALDTMVRVQTSNDAFQFLPVVFPELMQISTYLQADTGEVRIAATCNLEGMRSDSAFLNQFTLNADGLDAFVRDGLSPWMQQFVVTRELLDAALARGR